MTDLVVPTCGTDLLSGINREYGPPFVPLFQNTLQTGAGALPPLECGALCPLTDQFNTITGSASLTTCATCLQRGRPAEGTNPVWKPATVAQLKAWGCYACARIMGPWAFSYYAGGLRGAERAAFMADPTPLALPSAGQLRGFVEGAQFTSNQAAFHALPKCERAALVARTCGGAARTFTMAVDPLPVVSPFAPSADGTSGTSLSVAAWFGIIIGGVVLLGIFYGLWQRYKYNKSRNIAGRRDDKPPMGVHDQLLDQHEQNKIAAASASDQPFGDPGRDFPPVVLSDEQESPSAAHRSASSTVDSRLSDDDRTEEIARRNNPFNSSSRTGDPIIARGFATRIAGPQFSDNPEDLRPMVD